MENKVPVQQWLLKDLLRLLKTSFVVDRDTIQMTCPINQRQLEIYAEQIESLLNNAVILDKEKLVKKMVSTKEISRVEGSKLSKFKYDFNFHFLTLLDTNIIENCPESAEKFAEKALKEELKSEIEREFGYDK